LALFILVPLGIIAAETLNAILVESELLNRSPRNIHEIVLSDHAGGELRKT
jgi:hypothetical protein